MQLTDRVEMTLTFLQCIATLYCIGKGNLLYYNNNTCLQESERGIKILASFTLDLADYANTSTHGSRLASLLVLLSHCI